MNSEKCCSYYNYIFSLGHKPWYPHDVHYKPIWFVPMFAPQNYRGPWKWYAADEWRKMLDAWVYFIFKIPGFRIFKTTTRNLGKHFFLRCIFLNSDLLLIIVGIQTTEPLSSNDLSNKLVGFLENITEQQFQALHALRYPSLYSFEYSDEHNTVPKTLFFAIFGTVALCNNSQDTNVQLRNFDNVGKLVLWKTTMSFNDELQGLHDQHFSRFRSEDFFEVCDGQPSPNGDIIAPFGIEDMSDLRSTFYTPNGRRKLKFFVKVSLYDVNNIQYRNGETVYVKSSFHY